jgi:hypothetical protein
VRCEIALPPPRGLFLLPLLQLLLYISPQMDLKTAPLHYPREAENAPSSYPYAVPCCPSTLPSLLYHVTAVPPYHLSDCLHRASALTIPTRHVTLWCAHTFSHTWNTATLLFISLLDTFIFPTNKEVCRRCARRCAGRRAGRCARGCQMSRCVIVLGSRLSNHCHPFAALLHSR